MVAIPANNEARLLPACLAALAVQRDPFGAPLPEGTFGVVVLANNCTDATVETARRLAPDLPFALRVLAVDLPPELANAGGARKAAMDEAAFLMAGTAGAAILTTDADTLAAPTWVSANLRALAAGADAVAGYVHPNPTDYVALGAAFMARGRVEDSYVRFRDEIWARLDPVAHDPWPNHRVNAGASLAVSLRAYLEVGGVPLRPVGEDSELVRLLERAGRKVRHALDVQVTTSCRLEGRAGGGAAATMRARFEDVDAECDEDMEAAVATARRASCKGRLRRWYEARHATAVHSISVANDPDWPGPPMEAFEGPFADLWDLVEARDPRLRHGPRLRPSDLPREIGIARRLLARLRARDELGAPRRADSVGVVPEAEPERSAA